MGIVPQIGDRPHTGRANTPCARPSIALFRKKPDSLHSWFFAHDRRYSSMFPLFGLFLTPVCHARYARSFHSSPA
jgi:hypothetical protein